MGKTCAVIDIGTLKVKFVVVEVVGGGQIKDIYSSNTLTCFGCDLETNNGEVLPKNLARLIKELGRCKRLMAKYGVEKWRVVSTHVMRRIKNPEIIAQIILAKTSFEIEVITQEQEAELFFRAAMYGFENQSRDYVLVDVGGGSVQILTGRPGDRYPINWTQIPRLA